MATPVTIGTAAPVPRLPRCGRCLARRSSSRPSSARSCSSRCSRWSPGWHCPTWGVPPRCGTARCSSTRRCCSAGYAWAHWLSRFPVPSPGARTPGAAPGRLPVAPDRPGVVRAAHRQQRGAVRPDAAPGLGRAGAARCVGPGAPGAAVVRVRTRRQPLSAVRRVEPRQLHRAARLPAARRAAAPPGHPALGLDRRVRRARAARRWLRPPHRARPGRGRTAAQGTTAVARSGRSPLARRSVATWIVLSAVPSGLMLSTTTT